MVKIRIGMKKYLIAVITISLMLGGCENFSESKNENDIRKSTNIKGDMNFYFGNLHSHTEYSDGKGKPSEVLGWAKNTIQYDFYAITDHAMFLSDWEWKDIGEQCNNFTENGKFVAIRGFEWTQPFRGHINVFNTPDYRHVWEEWSLGNFYNWIRDHNAIGQWNHPGGEMPGDFNRLKIYKDDHIANMCAMETANKADGNNDAVFEYYFNKALDKGWKPAPAANQDNHSMSSNSHRTVIIARNLNRSELLDAMRKRRFYSSDDPNMKVIFKCQENWMGSSLKGSGPVTFQVAVEDDEILSKIELISNGGKIVESKVFNSETVHWEPIVDIHGKQYFYLKIYEQNTLDDDDGNDIQITLSAPIWFN